MHMTRLPYNRDCCDEVAGNTRAGKFLHKLVRWTNYTKLVRDGHRWTALTREGWAEETGLTLDQIRRILTSLGKAGIIVREQHMFGSKTPNFIRISDHGVAALEAAKSRQDKRFRPASGEVELRGSGGA